MRRAVGVGAVLGVLAVALLADACATPIEIPGAPDKAGPPYAWHDGGISGTADAAEQAVDKGLAPRPDAGSTDNGDGGLADAAPGDALIGDGATEASTADGGEDAATADRGIEDAGAAADGAAADTTPGEDDA